MFKNVILPFDSRIVYLLLMTMLTFSLSGVKGRAGRSTLPDLNEATCYFDVYTIKVIYGHL